MKLSVLPTLALSTLLLAACAIDAGAPIDDNDDLVTNNYRVSFTPFNYEDGLSTMITLTPSNFLENAQVVLTFDEPVEVVTGHGSANGLTASEPTVNEQGETVIIFTPNNKKGVLTPYVNYVMAVNTDNVTASNIQVIHD